MSYVRLAWRPLLACLIVALAVVGRDLAAPAAAQQGGYAPSFELTGIVDNPRTFTLADLQAYPSITLTAAFVAEGCAFGRYPFAANAFALAGPESDPAGIRGGRDVLWALRQIAEHQAPFLTRGDRSGTHLKEVELWEELGIQPSGTWYQLSAVGAQGNAATAHDAAARGAYLLVDQATLVVARPALAELVSGDPRLLNVFSALPLNAERLRDVDTEGAVDFVRWLLGPQARELIKDFGRSECGWPLFLAAADIPDDAGSVSPQPGSGVPARRQ